jgi:hypothetical protein
MPRTAFEPLCSLVPARVNATNLLSPRAPSTFERSPDHRSDPTTRDESRSPAEGRAVVDACSPRAARAFTVRLGFFGLSSDDARAGHPSKASATEMGPEHVPKGFPIPDHPMRSLPHRELETTRALPRLAVSSGGTRPALAHGECQSDHSGTGKDVQRRPRAPSRSLVRGAFTPTRRGPGHFLSPTGGLERWSSRCSVQPAKGRSA